MRSRASRLIEGRKLDEIEHSSQEAIIARYAENPAQLDGAPRAVSMQATAYDEPDGKFHLDFDEFFVELTVGDLVATDDDRDNRVRQEGVVARRLAGEST